LFEILKGEMTSLAKSISKVEFKAFKPGDEGLVSSKGVNLPKSNLPTLGMSIEEQSKIKVNNLYFYFFLKI
jgi:hypothetical protein